MNVAMRPDGHWRARYRGPDGKQFAKRFTRKVDAERWLTEQHSKLNRGEWVDRALGQVTVGAWAPVWLASKSGLKPTTRRTYEQVYRVHVEPRWGAYPLSRITYAEVVTWIAELTGRGLSPSRTGHALLEVKQLLDLAVLDGRVGRNVAAAVKAPRQRKGDQRFLTHGQLTALADECGGRWPQYRVLVLALGYTGLRWGDVRALHVKRLDLMRGRLEVSENLSEGSTEAELGAPKSHRRRVCPSPPRRRRAGHRGGRSWS